MRTLIFLLALATAPAASAQTLADFAWMKGCWRTEAPAEAGSVTTEAWIAPPMPSMIGYSYRFGEGETKGWEAARIDMIDGWPFYVAARGRRSGAIPSA